jgi:hypothetical protein
VRQEEGRKRVDVRAVGARPRRVGLPAAGWRRRSRRLQQPLSQPGGTALIHGISTGEVSAALLSIAILLETLAACCATGGQRLLGLGRRA